MQIFQDTSTVFVCRKVFFHKIAFAVNLRTIGRDNIFSGIYIIYCTFQTSVFILKCNTTVTNICISKNLTFFIYCQFSKLFLVRYCCGCSLTCYQLHIVSCRIKYIAFRCCDFFQIYGILCFYNRCRRFAIAVCFRHCSNQIFAICITVNTKYGSCKVYICCWIFLHNFYSCKFNPGYFEVHILFIIHAFSKYQCQILGSRSCGNLISRIIFCNASLHGRWPALCHITYLCQRCRQIKLCTTTDFNAFSGFTCFPCCQVMKLYTCRKFHSNCL